ncbi:MAG: PadR family transcriptional regulator [Bacteroidales bacterium]
MANAKSQIKKGILELCVLSITAGKDVYASDIIQTMKSKKLLIVEGTLYPLLTRLKNEGFLTYRWEESQSGPPRKYYIITTSGKKHLLELQHSWNNIKISVDDIIQNSHTI